MAGFETAPNGDLRVAFRLNLNGVKHRIRESLGVKATKDKKREVRRDLLGDIETALATKNWKELVRLCPGSIKRFRELGLVQDGAQVTFTMKELIALVERDYEQNKHSNLQHLKSTVKHVLKFPAFVNLLAMDCTAELVKQYITWRQGQKKAGGKPYANATINRELSAIVRGFTLAVETGRLTHAPQIKLLEEDNARQGFFTRDLIDAFKRHLPEYLHDMLEAGNLTGWRKSELSLLTFTSHVDFKEGWLKLNVGETKNDRPRFFPMNDTPELREILERRYRENREYMTRTGKIFPWVFHRDGEQIVGFRKAWDHAVRAINAERRAAGLPALPQKPLFHDLRRTAVLHLELAAVPRSSAKAITGHLTDAVYENYIPDDLNLLREAGRKLNAHREEEAGKVVPILSQSGSANGKKSSN
jgi:hypothetical protein